MNVEKPASRRRSLIILLIIIIGMITIVSIAIAAALTVLLSDEDEPILPLNTRYEEVFLEAGRWGEGAQPGPDGSLGTGTVGRVKDGVYDLQLFGANGIYWATAGESFADGRYEVDVTFVDGPLDNAGGLVLMFENDNFYFFVVRGDGNGLIARCGDGCADFEIIANQGWFATDADWGVNSQNRLRVDVAGGQLSFYVNDGLAAEVVDDNYEEGDVGVIVTSGAEGDAHFQFDNILVDWD